MPQLDTQHVGLMKPMTGSTFSENFLFVFRIVLFAILTTLICGGCEARPPDETRSISLYLSWRMNNGEGRYSPAVKPGLLNVAIAPDGGNENGEIDQGIIDILHETPHRFGHVDELLVDRLLVTLKVGSDPNPATGYSSYEFEHLRQKASALGYDFIITYYLRSGGGLALYHENMNENTVVEATAVIADVKTGMPLAFEKLNLETGISVSSSLNESRFRKAISETNSHITHELIIRLIQPLLN